MGKRAQGHSAEAVKVQRFARSYVLLVEALQQQGVPEEIARSEARTTAMVWLMEDDQRTDARYDPAKGPCPTCGNG